MRQKLIPLHGVPILDTVEKDQTSEPLLSERPQKIMTRAQFRGLYQGEQILYPNPPNAGVEFNFVALTGQVILLKELRLTFTASSNVANRIVNGKFAQSSNTVAPFYITPNILNQTANEVIHYIFVLNYGTTDSAADSNNFLRMGIPEVFMDGDNFDLFKTQTTNEDSDDQYSVIAVRAEIWLKRK